MESTLELRRPGGLARTCGKLWALMAASAQRRLSHLGELAVRSSFLAIMLFVFSQLWREVSLHVTARPGGYDLAQLVWYLAFAEAIVFTTPSNQEPELDREVRTGDIAYRVARPLAFPLHHLAVSFGDRLVRFAFNLAFGLTVAWLLVGAIPLRLEAWVAAFGAALLAISIDELVVLALSLTAFWFESTVGFHLLYRRAMLLLGGALVPLTAYPDWLADVCRALPFQYYIAGPAALFVGESAGGFGALVAMQLAWASAIALVAIVLYHFGLQRVVAQGG